MASRGRTPLRAVVEHAAPLPDTLPEVAWRHFMSVTEVARITGVSYNTLLKWLDEELCQGDTGCTLRDRVCVRVDGNVWIKTPAFRLWMKGKLPCILCQRQPARDEAPAEAEELAG